MPPMPMWDDAETGQELLVLQGQAGRLVCVTYSPDGKRLMSGAEDEVKLWDAETGAELLALKRGGRRGVVFSPDGHRLVSAGDDVTIWDATPLPAEPQAKDKAP